MKFKIGDRVKVIKTIYENISVGDIKEIIDVGEECYRLDNGCGMTLSFYEDEIELIETQDNTKPNEMDNLILIDSVLEEMNKDQIKRIFNYLESKYELH